MTIRSSRWLFLAILSVVMLSWGRWGYAQAAAPSPSGSEVVVQDPFGAAQVIKVDGTAPPGMMPPGVKRDESGAKPDEKKDGESKDAKPGDAKDEVKKEERPSTLKRPITPPAPADPTELDIRPDADGRVRFNFRGQSWPDVLDWLASVSAMSLDWQELPGDYLNLTTQRSYSVAEARDLINRHLLARGYTLLVVNETLTVVKTENVNGALVPRVEPEELADRLAHEYVKVSFPLDWLIAETAVEELKPMLSPNGKLTALKTTNRLEALDAAANLRELYAVLTREQSTTSQERLVREFVLKYARATDVSDQIKGLLGIDAKSGGPQMPMSPQQMAQMQQQQQQMMAQMQQQQQQPGQRGGRSPTSGSKGQEDVNLVVNPRRNSVLVNAPPDKMAIIIKAIDVIDVPLDRDQSLLLNVNRMQVYRLAQLDPETLIKTLQDSGDLDPTTRLEADRKNKAIIAYAPLTDHLMIRTLVQKLDGSGRQFEVIRLRRLEADYVSGTITFMMGQEQKTEERSRYYGYWDSRPRSSEESGQDKFRVDADVAGNRLLLWANDVEMEEVRKLLVKLGEIPSEGGNPDRVRVLELEAGDGVPDLLEQIRRTWPALAPNPIILPPPESLSKPARPAAEPADAGAVDVETRSAPGNTTGQPMPSRAQMPVEADMRPAPFSSSAALVRFAQLTAEAASLDERPADAPAEPGSRFPDPNAGVENRGPGKRAAPASTEGEAAAPAPIQIAVGPDGRLVISSQDTAALDLLEELLAQLAPARKDFKIFPLKHASALWVKLNLQDYFKTEPEDKSRRRNVFYFDYYQPPADKEKSYRLSQRKPLKFIDDLDTNTILVVGASAEQLRTIEDLIQLWDASPPSDSQSARLTAVFAIRYSKAETIAETVKEVYLDLLSSNDKALQRNRDEKRPSNQTTYIFGETGGSEPDRRTQVSFKGKLSIGVDAVSNTLLVSTEGQTLMENVGKMIQALDEAAKPLSEVQVVALKGNVNAEHVRKVLAEMLSEKITQPGPGGATPHPPGGPHPGQPAAAAPAGGRGD